MAKVSDTKFQPELDDTALTARDISSKGKATSEGGLAAPLVLR